MAFVGLLSSFLLSFKKGGIVSKLISKKLPRALAIRFVDIPKIAMHM